MTMAQEAAKQPVQIKISDIITMLNNGIDRKGIAKHYGLTQATVKRLFEHEQLKNRRVKPTVPVELIDDVTSTVAAEATPQKEEAAAELVAAPAPAAPAAEVAQATPQAATSTDKGVW